MVISAPHGHQQGPWLDCSCYIRLSMVGIQLTIKYSEYMRSLYLQQRRKPCRRVRCNGHDEVNESNEMR